MEGDISRILFMQQSILTGCRHTVLCDLPAASNGPFSCSCLLGLAPGGVYLAVRITADAVSSYLTISPLPLAGRYLFCCTFHRLAAPGYYPAPCPAVFGLSSPPRTRDFPEMAIKAITALSGTLAGAGQARRIVPLRLKLTSGYDDGQPIILSNPPKKRFALDCRMISL